MCLGQKVRSLRWKLKNLLGNLGAQLHCLPASVGLSRSFGWFRTKTISLILKNLWQWASPVLSSSVCFFSYHKCKPSQGARIDGIPTLIPTVSDGSGDQSWKTCKCWLSPEAWNQWHIFNDMEQVRLFQLHHFTWFIRPKPCRCSFPPLKSRLLLKIQDILTNLMGSIGSQHLLHVWKQLSVSGWPGPLGWRHDCGHINKIGC